MVSFSKIYLRLRIPLKDHYWPMVTTNGLCQNRLPSPNRLLSIPFAFRTFHPLLERKRHRAPLIVPSPDSSILLPCHLPPQRLFSSSPLSALSWPTHLQFKPLTLLPESITLSSWVASSPGHLLSSISARDFHKSTKTTLAALLPVYHYPYLWLLSSGTSFTPAPSSPTRSLGLHTHRTAHVAGLGPREVIAPHGLPWLSRSG